MTEVALATADAVASAAGTCPAAAEMFGVIVDVTESLADAAAVGDAAGSEEMVVVVTPSALAVV